MITAIDGKAVQKVSDIADSLAGHKPGDTVSLTINRDGKQQQLSVTLQAWPKEASQ